jgi:hypothetical protein
MKIVRKIKDPKGLIEVRDSNEDKRMFFTDFYNEEMKKLHDQMVEEAIEICENSDLLKKWSKPNHNVNSITSGYRIESSSKKLNTKTEGFNFEKQNSYGCQSFYRSLGVTVGRSNTTVRTFTSLINKASGNQYFNTPFTEKFYPLIQPILNELDCNVRFYSLRDPKDHDLNDHLDDLSCIHNINHNVEMSEEFYSELKVDSGKIMMFLGQDTPVDTINSQLARFSIIRTLFGADNVGVFQTMIYLYYKLGLKADVAVSAACQFLYNMHSRKGYKNIADVSVDGIIYIPTQNVFSKDFRMTSAINSHFNSTGYCNKFAAEKLLSNNNFTKRLTKFYKTYMKGANDKVFYEVLKDYKSLKYKVGDLIPLRLVSKADTIGFEEPKITIGASTRQYLLSNFQKVTVK